MKIFSVFSFIALVHIAIIGTLLVQPGCQSKPKEAPDPSTTRVESTQPQRTLAPSQSSSNNNGRVDSAFNAGLEPERSSRQLSEPMRPVVNTELTNEIDDSVLQPVNNFGGGSSSTTASTTTTYKVVRGDTLSGIARKEGVSLEGLMRANNLTKASTIFVGQELVIPKESVSRVTVDQPSVSSSGQTYTVRPGDTLSTIAKRNGVTVANLKSVNSLTSDTIYVGQELSLPSGGSSSTSATSGASAGRSSNVTSGGGTEYEVRSGDTPGGIAKRFGVSTQALMQANGITDPRKLFVGQKLVIPGGSSRPSTVSTNTTSSSTTTTRTTTSTNQSNTRPQVTAPVVSQGSNTGGTLTPRSSSPEPLPSTSTTEAELLRLEALDDEELPFSDVEEVNP